MIFYNPAQLSAQPGLSASIQRFGDASTAGAVASSFSAGPLAGAAGAQFLDFGRPALGGTRASLGERGGQPAASLSGGIGAAMSVKGTRVGIAVKYVEERVAEARDGAAALDVGLAREVPGRATAGLAIQNIGSALAYGGEERPMPTQVTLGGSAAAPPLFTWFDLAATTAVTWRRDGRWIPAGGLELSYVPLDGWAFTGRVGARRRERDLGIQPFTAGAGVSLDRLSLDYGFQPLDQAAGSHRIGIRLR